MKTHIALSNDKFKIMNSSYLFLFTNYLEFVISFKMSLQKIKVKQKCLSATEYTLHQGAIFL